MESPPSSLRDRDLLRRWAETWRRAEVELEPIRRRELRSLDTQETIRQIFGEQDKASQPSPGTGGAGGMVRATARRERAVMTPLLEAAREL